MFGSRLKASPGNAAAEPHAAAVSQGFLRTPNSGLSRSLGNHYLHSMATMAVPGEESSGEGFQTVQTKLTVGAVGDTFEQEADRVASRVMRMSDSKVQRKAA